MSWLILSLSIAHAGWWSSFCSKHLVAQDPQQFEQTDTAWLIRQYDALRIRKAHGRLRDDDREQLSSMRKQLEFRVQYGPAGEVDMIMEVLK